MTRAPLPGQPGSAPERDAGGHGGHRWMMIACCIPMLAIALILLATGVAGVGFLGSAILCTLMMGGMGHGGSQRSR